MYICSLFQTLPIHSGPILPIQDSRLLVIMPMEFEDIQNICARHITHADTIHDIHKRFLQSAQILSRAAIPN